MKMTEGEIIRDYAEAKDKNKQIGILADMNLVTKKEMASWLADRGQQVDKRLLAGDPRKRKEKPIFIPDEPEPELTEEQEEKFARILDSVDEGKKLPAPKAPDQTAKADAGKLRLSLVPGILIRACAVVRMYGCRKYPEGGPDNWKQVEIERFRDAMYRHWVAYIENPRSVDPESGLPHLYHCICNLAFLAEMENYGDVVLYVDDPEVDDGR